MAIDPDSGEPILQATHAINTGDPPGADNVYFHFVANAATGKMLNVLAQPSTQDCGDGARAYGQFYPRGLGTKSYILTHSDRTTDGSPSGPEGWVGGSWEQPWPTTTVKVPRLDDTMTSGWRASSRGVFRVLIDAYVENWDGSKTENIFPVSKEPDGLAIFEPVTAGNDAFFEVGGNVEIGIWAWSDATGRRPILRWFGDSTRGAGSFGTDGKDMVWIYGEGKAAGSEDNYPKLDIMTAPYSLDPDKVKTSARRLRSQPDRINGRHYAVGCGYAARDIFVNDGKTFNGLLIIRLSDGVSWVISGAEKPSELSWGHALGMTCSHVYALFGNGGLGRIGRVALDSLGPGLPPD